jgi:hypothetical protein
MTNLIYHVVLGAIRQHTTNTQQINDYLNQLILEGWLSGEEAQEILRECDLDFCQACQENGHCAVVEPVTRLEASGLNTYCPTCGAMVE